MRSAPPPGPRRGRGDAAGRRPPQPAFARRPPSADARPRPPAPPSRNDRPPLGQEDRRSAICAPIAIRAVAAAAAGPDAGPAAAADPRTHGRRRAAAPTTAPPQAPGMRGFRDIAADADDLGRAAAQANRAARKTYANVPSPSPEFDRLEPSMENRGADPDAPYSYDEFDRGGRALRAAAAGSAPARVRRTASRKSARAPARCFRSRARSRSASC